MVMRGRPVRSYHLSDINIDSGGGGGDEFVQGLERVECSQHRKVTLVAFSWDSSLFKEIDRGEVG